MRKLIARLEEGAKYRWKYSVGVLFSRYDHDVEAHIARALQDWSDENDGAGIEIDDAETDTNTSGDKPQEELTLSISCERSISTRDLEGAVQSGVDASRAMASEVWARKDR